MEIDLTTPALLFSAISLIMLAYTNRFLSYAQLVRTLKEQPSAFACGTILMQEVRSSNAITIIITKIISPVIF